MKNNNIYFSNIKRARLCFIFLFSSSLIYAQTGITINNPTSTISSSTGKINLSSDTMITTGPILANKIGIGTTTPAYQLDVVGTMHSSGNYTTPHLNLFSSGTNGLQLDGGNYTITSSINFISFSSDTLSTTGGLKAGNVVFKGNITLPNDTIGDTNLHLMQIDKYGNLKPVHSSTLYTFIHPGWSPCTTGFVLYQPEWFYTNLIAPSYTSTSHQGVIATDKCTWVGIGLNTPDAPLSISGSNPTNIQFSVYNGSSLSDVYSIDGVGNTIQSGNLTMQGGALTMVNPSATANVFTVDNSGNTYAAGKVGIGTTSPDATLNVKTTTSGNQFAVTNGSTDEFTIDNNGNTNIAGTVTLGGNSSYNWTTGSGSPYTPATSSSSWNVPLIIPNGSAIRTYTKGANGRYLGFGMVDGPSTTTSTTGWYWMVQADTVISGVRACYPMTLIMDLFGNATLTVSQNGWCDYVFDNCYKAMSIDEKEKYYKTYKHLPGIDSTGTIEEKGLNINKNMKGMLQNIEEDRLDITSLYKVIKQQQQEIEDLKKEVIALKK